MLYLSKVKLHNKTSLSLSLSRTHTGTTSFIIYLRKFSKHYVFISLQCQGQNKEPEPQQSTAFTPTAASQECQWLSWSLIYKNLNAFTCSVVSLLYFQMRTNIIPTQYKTHINVDKGAKQSWVTVTTDLQKINWCLWCPKCRLQPMFAQLQHNMHDLYDKWCQTSFQSVSCCWYGKNCKSHLLPRVTACNCTTCTTSICSIIHILHSLLFESVNCRYMWYTWREYIIQRMLENAHLELSEFQK